MQLLDKAAALRRGASASDNDKAEIEKLIQEVERTNPTREPLKSPLMNGRWELKYTTSASILVRGYAKISRQLAAWSRPLS